jgi:hypothetical protein
MHTFKGFDDWIEVFRGGEQTDSAGRTRTWTAEEIDQIVANHSADDPAPAVLGHPRADRPAYAWTSELKRDGDKLLAKFTDVDPQFEQIVKAGRYKKRSVAIARRPEGGLYLRHVGWLGAQEPAVSGLKHPTFSDAAAEVFEFEVDWRTPSLLGRTLRRIREWIISEHDVETADKHVPEHLIDEAQYLTDDAKREPDPDDPDFAAQFTHDDGDRTVPKPKDGNPPSDTQTFTQADIDAAVQAERDKYASELEQERRARRLHEHQQFVSSLNAPPAITAGMPEFMLALEDSDDAQFEFSAGEGDKAQKQQLTPLAWFKAHVGQLQGKFDHLFEERGNGEDHQPPSTYDAPGGYNVDPDALELHNKAMEYMQNHNGVEYVQAVQIVERQGA